LVQRGPAATKNEQLLTPIAYLAMSALVAPRFGDLRGNKTNSRGTLIEQEIGRHTLLANLKLR